jgi:hypothetical protein
MKLALLAASCVLASLIAACTIAQNSAPVTAIGVIELFIIDEQGWPLNEVAIFVEGEAMAVPTGGIALTVSGPVWIVAFRPGFAPSQPTLMLPGHREIVLYKSGRVNE